MTSGDAPTGPSGRWRRFTSRPHNFRLVRPRQSISVVLTLQPRPAHSAPRSTRMRRRLIALASLLAVAAAPLAVLAAPAQAATDGAVLLRVHRGQQQQQGARDLQRHRRGRSTSAPAATTSRCSSTAAPPPGLTINLTGTVAAGDVYVLAHSSANAAILAQADQTNGAGWFNGDDAWCCARARRSSTSIGQIGNDPGTEWGTGSTEHRRQHPASQGVGRGRRQRTGRDAFDPAIEWDGFATDTFDGIGLPPDTTRPPRR